MATRTINTVFKVGGESEYRAAVKRINAAIQELNSEMKLSEARFEGQENSYAALFSKQQQLERMYEQQSELAQTYASRLKAVQDATNLLNDKSEELEDTLNQLNAAMYNTSKNSTAYDELAKDAEKAEEELRSVQTQMQKNATTSMELQTGLNKAQTEMENLGRELEDLRPKVKEAEESTDGFAHSMEDVGEEAGNMRVKTTDALDAIASAAGAAKIDEFFRKVLDVMKDCVEASVEFESAMAGVFKVIDATDAEELALTNGIKELSTQLPVTTTELAAVAEAAGQLGIEKDAILDFTETMVKMGSTTNISSEEAATAIARISTVLGIATEDYERVGSSIVELGNNFAATESEIVAMAERMAGSGALIGLTADEIFGISAALTQVGIDAEAGGTAMQKLFQKIQLSMSGVRSAQSDVESFGISVEELTNAAKTGTMEEFAKSIGLSVEVLEEMSAALLDTNKYAEVAGMGATDFARLWEEDAAGAIAAFIEGLSGVEKSGGDVIAILSDMGLSEVRLSRAITTLAASEGLLTEALDMSKAAWEENTALAEEAAKRYETTESKITIMKNSVTLLKQELGEDFANAVAPGVEKLTDFAIAAAESAEESPALATALAGVGGALGGLAGLSTVAAGIQLVVKALSLFGAAAGPVGIGVAALGGLAAAVAVYNANAYQISAEAEALIEKNDALIESSEHLTESWDALQMENDAKEKQVQSLIDKVSELSGKLNKTPSDVAVLSSAVDQLNGILPGLGLAFDEQTGKINMTREAMVKFAETSLEVAKMEAAKKYVQELSETQGDLQFQYDLTRGKVREAMKAYEEAEAEVEKYTEGLTGVQKALEYTNPTFIKLKEAETSARKELEELQERQAGLSDSLVTVGEDLAEATAQYDAYASEIVTVGEAVEETAQSFENSAALQSEATRRMIEDGQAAYDQALQDAQDYYDEQLEIFQNGLDDELEALEDKFSAEKKAAQRHNRDLLKDFKDAQKEKQKALEEALAEEMAALEAQYAEKKALIDQEYADRLALLGDDERNQEIVNIDAEIEALEAITKAEEEARKLKQQEDKKAALQKKIDDAKDREDKEEAEKKLADYLAELEQKRIEAEREAKIKALEEDKKRLQEELEAEAKNIEESKKQAIEGLEGKLAEEKTRLEASYEEKRAKQQEELDKELTAYQDMLDDSIDALNKKHSKELENIKKQNQKSLEEKKKSLKEEKEALERNAEKEFDIVKKNADSMIGEWHRYFDAVVAEATAISGEVQAAGEAVGEAFVAGLEKGLSGVESATKTAASAKKLAKVVDDTARDVLQVRSPSRVAMKTFGYYGEGAVLGLRSKLEDIKAAADELIRPLTDTGEIAGSLEAGRDVLRQNAAAVTGNPVYFSGESGGTINNTYNITIPASDVKEFNDIVRIAQAETVSTRMGYIKR